MLSSSALTATPHLAHPSRPQSVAALLLLCLLIATLPFAHWRAHLMPSQAPALRLNGQTMHWGIAQALTSGSTGRRLPANSRIHMPLDPTAMLAGLYPAMPVTLNRTSAPAYRLAPLPVSTPTRSVGGYAGANPDARLQLWLDGAGLLLRQQGRPETLHLAFAGIGRGRSLASLPSAQITATGNEVHYDRGGVEEWYRNGPLGLEQGFTLATPPTGRGNGPLTLRLRLTGNVTPRLAGDTLLLGSHGLRYTGLYAADAAERRLPARITLGRTPGS